MKVGRPSSYTPEIGNEICERIACGEALKGIVRDEAMPSERTVFRWLSTNDAFRQQYTRAREAQADADADAVSDIAARVLSGEIDPQAARAAVDALKWSAGKRNPKRYGDKTAVEHSGNIGLANILGTLGGAGDD